MTTRTHSLRMKELPRRSGLLVDAELERPAAAEPLRLWIAASPTLAPTRFGQPEFGEEHSFWA
jgi:hypothetical protein